MRRVRKSRYIFDAGKLRDRMRESSVDLDELQGLMRTRGHRVEVKSYLNGQSAPSSEVLVDLVDILGIDISPVVKAVFSMRSTPLEDE